jgi:hypothetical protein
MESPRAVIMEARRNGGSPAGMIVAVAYGVETARKTITASKKRTAVPDPILSLVYDAHREIHQFSMSNKYES